MKSIVALLALSAVGCPAALEHPERFSNCTTITEHLFAKKCATCHNAAVANGGLDLESGEVGPRLAYEMSTDCEGAMLVDPENPTKSLLYQKLTQPPPGCGDPMPLLTNRRATSIEMNCLVEWITAQGTPQ